MKMYMQREQEAVKEEQGQEEVPEIESESEDETARKKIGDKLFEEDEEPINLREMAKDMDP
jgi:hypothetical protein